MTKPKKVVKPAEETPQVVENAQVELVTPVQTVAEAQEIRAISSVIDNREIVAEETFGKLTRGQIDLMKRTIAKGASDDELRLFLQVCKGANLNPFLKQVHLVPRWDAKLGKEVRSIQVGIDGFRGIAEESRAYAGNDDPIYTGEIEVEYGKDKRKVKCPEIATVSVYKIVAGQRYPFTATARWSEYYPGERIGFQWHNRPYLMLGKCAEALALRKAFPKLLSGMYVQEEMDKEMQDGGEKKVVSAAQTVLSAIGRATKPETLEEYGNRILKSDKYSEEQKQELMSAIGIKLDELKKLSDNK